MDGTQSKRLKREEQTSFDGTGKGKWTEVVRNRKTTGSGTVTHYSLACVKRVKILYC